MAELLHQNNRFVFKCAFHERELPKLAGFRWAADLKQWYTTDMAAASKLLDYAPEPVKKIINNSLIQIIPWEKPLPPPPPGLEMMPHQVEGAKFLLSRNRAYLGADPRLGKTIVAANVARALKATLTYYVCPPFLVQNVREEFAKWAPEIALAILPDSQLHKFEPLKATTNLIFIDEAHRFKSEDSKRSKLLLGYKGKKEHTKGIVDYFSRRYYLSGTPMPNRPIELYSILSKEAPETIDWMGKFKYALKYCAAHKNDYDKWDFNGASNMQDLSARVLHPTGPFMLRQRRSLLNLPPKIEETFVVSTDMSPRLSEFGRELGARYRDMDDLIKRRFAVAQGVREDDLHIGTYRRLLGQEKVKPTIEYVKALLEESDEKILIFAYHKDVIAWLYTGLISEKPLRIDGDTPIENRQALVKTFQQDPIRRIMIGNYVAMGVGFNLSKANRVIFCEFDWVPGVNEQAADRAVDMRKKDSVLVQYVVFKDSIDKAVVETLMRKKRNLAHV